MKIELPVSNSKKKLKLFPRYFSALKSLNLASSWKCLTVYFIVTKRKTFQTNLAENIFSCFSAILFIPRKNVEQHYLTFILQFIQKVFFKMLLFHCVFSSREHFLDFRFCGVHMHDQVVS